MTGLKFTLLRFLAVCLPASRQTFLNLGLWTLVSSPIGYGYQQLLPEVVVKLRSWFILRRMCPLLKASLMSRSAIVLILVLVSYAKHPAFGRLSIKPISLLSVKHMENLQGLPRFRGHPSKNHLNRQWGTLPASFVSLQTQDSYNLWFLAFTLMTLFLPVFLSTRHPFISQHKVQATLWHGQIYSFFSKIFSFTQHGL